MYIYIYICLTTKALAFRAKHRVSWERKVSCVPGRRGGPFLSRDLGTSERGVHLFSVWIGWVVVVQRLPLLCQYHYTRYTTTGTYPAYKLHALQTLLPKRPTQQPHAKRRVDPSANNNHHHNNHNHPSRSTIPIVRSYDGTPSSPP